MEAYMRHERILAEDVWYLVNTAANIGEPLFDLPWARNLFSHVLRDAKGIFSFEIRGLVLDGATLSFCIKPADGFELPKIMQWIKQTFSARFNALTGRSGHVWGDRYSSEILEEEPPEDAEEVNWEKVEVEANTKIPADTTYKLSCVSLRQPEITLEMSSSRKKPPKPAAPTG
jgi:hypothetical protein